MENAPTPIAATLTAADTARCRVLSRESRSRLLRFREDAPTITGDLESPPSAAKGLIEEATEVKDRRNEVMRVVSLVTVGSVGR